ncbi:MAG TPA: hypothetical protein VNB22_18205 [Pyrinomonadaceae bacterium]|nr:hypothetical protein [Pyrinomonadaceae bacterium]
MKKSIFGALTIIFIGAVSICAQTPVAKPTPPPIYDTIPVAVPNPPALETILTETQKQTEFYRETFRNLLADELKTFEEFYKKGNSDKKATVKSSFLVYQSGKNAKTTAELRNVLEVNGKLIPDSQKRGEEFLAELDKQTTLESELKKLEKESSKYDNSWTVYGLTLNEAVALAPNLRPNFDFKLLGTENYQGNEVYVVSFQQTKKSPNITVDNKNLSPDQFYLSFGLDLPGSLKKEGVFLRGKLWIDAKTFQIWREERDLTAQVSQPLVILSTIFEYQTSDYGILVPKNIVLTVYNAKKDGSKYYTVKDTTIGFEYSKFRQTNVDVKILDEETE